MTRKPLTDMIDWSKAMPERDGSSVVEVTVGLRLRRGGEVDLFANADQIREAADIPEFLEQVGALLRTGMKAGKARSS